MSTMHDAVTITLIILAAALLRRSLLPSPDVAPGVRVGERASGKTALVPILIEADRPQSARRGQRDR